jgi:hypothetical protein
VPRTPTGPGLPVVGVAPETNRLDLAAIALASARGETVGPWSSTPLPPAPESPAVGIPVARSAPPISGPLPTYGAAAAGPYRSRGSLRDRLSGRRGVAALAVAGAIAGAGVAVVGVTSALAAPEPAPTQQAPAPKHGAAWGAKPNPGAKQGSDAEQGSGAKADPGYGSSDASSDASGGY